MKACLILAFAALTSTASATFHLMQIEQVVASLNGNPAAQAVQLRMRSTGENLVSNAKLWAADATGSNRVLLLDITADVTAFASGSRVLLATSAFTTAVQAATPTFTPDFTLATPIPASYLAAGRITYETNAGTPSTAGTIYWSLAWGGAGYTGSNTGSTLNDSDGNYGPPFASSLPTSGAQGIRFTGVATALSTSNSADYALSANPATVVRNNGNSFLLPLLTPIEAWRQTNFGTTANSGNAADDFDFDKDGLVNLIEFALALDPKQNSPHLVPHGQIAGGNFTLSFAQPAGVSGITYGAESSTTLQAAGWTPVSDAGSNGQHVFSIPVVDKGFLRLKVTDP